MASITIAIVALGWATLDNKIGFWLFMFVALAVALGEVIDKGLK